MYVTLFKLAGYAAPAWLLLILLPTWRWTRRIADSAIFPAYLAALYVVGLVPLLVALGPGVMRDFGSAEGVTRLLASQDVAMVAWIHILTFDQVVGLLIYRDNMQHRCVPLPLQSVLLFLTLLFGPVGFLAYYFLRLLRRHPDRSGAGTAPLGAGADDVGAARPPGPSVVGTPAPRATGRTILALFAGERQLLGTGLVGLGLGVLCLAAVAVRGRFVPPEGDLEKAATFDIAVGIYVLTVALLAPLAGFSERGRRTWRWWLVGLTTYAYAIENIQAFRGFDPRFSRISGPVDQMAGGIFFLVALGLIANFLVLGARFFRRRATLASPLLALGVRYGCAATIMAFAAGLWMSAIQGRHFGTAGNVLPLHAAGFHGLQAVPLVALLLGWTDVSVEAARRWVHLAGFAWLGWCAAIAWQTGLGRSVREFAPATGIALALLLAWAVVVAWAALAWRRKARLEGYAAGGLRRGPVTA